MRLLLSILFIVAVVQPLRAADAPQKNVPQERKLIDRLMKPNRELKFDPGQHSVSGVRAFRSKGASTKKFYADRKTEHEPKPFSSKGYGTKSSWRGDFKFATTSAKTKGKNEIHNLDKKPGTKSVAEKNTKEARDAGKTAATRDHRDENREFLGADSKKVKTAVSASKGNAWKGDLQPLSIDDVRALLNKYN